MAVAVWCRVLLPQLLGQQLPSTGNQKPASAAAVPRLSASGATAALDYLETVLQLARSTSSGPVLPRVLGPADSDPKGPWAFKVSDTELLRASLTGISVQVSPLHSSCSCQAFD